jgi:WD40 repeat protein
MNVRSDFDPIVTSWLDAQAGRGAPGYLDEVLAVTSRTRQRPAWSSPERWLPVQLTLSQRIRPIPNLTRVVAIAAILALIVAGLLVAAAGQRHVPHFGFAANGPLTWVDGATIKLASADGETVRAGAAIPAGSESLTFSPDGTRLAYRTPGGPASIVIADADGGHAHPVTNIAAASSAQVSVDAPFAFAPDGGRIAFTAMQATYRSIRLVGVDGSNPTTLAPVGIADVDETFDPAWSPDGQWIAFFWTQPAKSLTQIYLVHPDGSGGHVLAAAHPDPYNLELAWSPDPAQPLLAYVEGDDAGGGNIAIRDITSSKVVYAGSGLWITWSPDGRQIAFWGGQTAVASVADVLAGRSRTTYLFPANSGATCAVHPELAGQAICGPAQWSPDSMLVYGTDVSGKMILVRRADGTGSVLKIPLDHPVDITNGPNGSLAWQAVAP